MIISGIDNHYSGVGEMFKLVEKSSSRFTFESGIHVRFILSRPKIA